MIRLLILFLCISCTLQAQPDKKKKKNKPSIFDFFSKNEIMDITLEAAFDSILMNKRFNENLPATIYYRAGEDLMHTIPVKVKVRGKYRRRVCDFPPLRLKFKKSNLDSMGIRKKYNTLKLVTHCLDDKYAAKENILREYLIYKLYELHADLSFRVHLVNLTYKKTGSKKKMFERLGFIIESEEELADRFGGEVYEKLNISVDSLQPYCATLQAMFQCMVSNADWSLRAQRNIALVRMDGQKKLNIVPYDFDFSGIVDAPYAIPNPDYKLKNLRHRIFLGKTYSEENLKKVTQHFLSKKEAVLAYCKNFDLLPKSSRKDIIRYLKTFYEKIENPSAMKEAYFWAPKSATH